MTIGGYILRVDWDGDGLFSPNEAVFPYTFPIDFQENLTSDGISLEFTIGRDRASQLTGRSVAGRLTAVLRNHDGKYNSFQAASPIYGNILPKRKVQVQTGGSFPYDFPFVFAGDPLWTGFLESIEPQPKVSGQHEAILRAVGPLAVLKASKVRVIPQANRRTDLAIGDVLDAAGWPAADRSLETGKTTMTRWWASDIDALEAMREVEETEAGFIRETKDGKVKFEDRQYRLSGARLTSQATYSDVLASLLPIIQVSQDDPLPEIFNIFRAVVKRQTVGGLATLWTLGESGASSPPIEPGETRTWTALYPIDSTALENFGVDAWTTPVATTDYLANAAADGSGANLTASMVVAVTKALNSMDISITNNAAVTAYMTLLQARGTPLVAQGGTGVEEQVAASITKYGEREYPSPAPFIPTTNAGRDHMRFLAVVYSEPIPALSILFDANVSPDTLAEALLRDVSDRVTVQSDFASDLGISGDFFVESVMHRIDRFRRHLVQLELSSVSGYSGFLVWGKSIWNQSSALAY